MLNKLAARNAKRSMKEYGIYLVTLAAIAALMLAFDSMIFSGELKRLYAQGGAVMAAMLGLATFFIVFIITWLVHYMIRFMLEKRGREFGTYMLLGLKRKEISRLFLREHFLLGAAAFCMGILPGLFFEQVLTAVFYHICRQEYHLTVELSKYGFLMTVALFGAIYCFAVMKNKRRFKKMEIHELLYLDRQNEKLYQKQGSRSAVCFFAAVLYMGIFMGFLLTGSFTVENLYPMIFGLIFSIYLFYIGICGAVNGYLQRKGRGIYQGANLFLLRQMASKIKTMRFTMGTLTVLFTAALVGGSAAMMLSDYQNKMLESELPFDVIMFSDEKQDAFKEQIGILQESTQVEETLVYQVYENNSTAVRDYLYETLPYLEGKAAEEKTWDGSRPYFDWDTYLKLSDYNALLAMLGEKPAVLEDGEYLIQTKERISPFLQDFPKENEIEVGGRKLSCRGIATVPFAQSGENGADYILVVPDDAVREMEAFYSLLAADLKGKVPEDLQMRLADTQDYEDSQTGEMKTRITWGYGTNQVVTMASTVLVKENMAGEMRFILTATSYPLFYVGMIFLCVAMTILSVQQMSDSAKYKFRYGILSKLGLRESAIDRVILKQLLLYYLCPVLLAAVLSGILSIFAGQRFVFYTGIKTSVLFYYGASLMVFLGIWIIYFAATYVGFKKNLVSERRG